jgi:NAD(P)-dependent dehydrogenase (short-subunit alcohol dehydrogenase family)
LLHLTRTIGAEINESNVTIFAFSPGLVYTDMTKDVPLFKTLPDSAWVPVERAGELCVLLASGFADKLSGRYFHVSEDDIEELVAQADDVIEKDTQVLQFRRLTD